MDYSHRFNHMAHMLAAASANVAAMGVSAEQATESVKKLSAQYKLISVNELTPPGKKATRKEKKAHKRLRTALRVGLKEPK